VKIAAQRKCGGKISDPYPSNWKEAGLCRDDRGTAKTRGRGLMPMSLGTVNEMGSTR